MCGVISLLFQVYWWILLARALMSWVNPDPYNPIVRVINQLTEPYLAPFRRFVPAMGMFDISFIVAVIALQLISGTVISILASSGVCFYG